MTTQWPKMGVFLFNACGTVGYKYMPQTISRKLSHVMSTTDGHKRSDTKSGRNVETVICEMIFGSVALNFCAKDSSKMHKLSEDLLMTCFTFKIDFSNGKTCHKKYGLSLIWDTNELDGQLRQLILKESLIMDSLIAELKSDLIECRLKSLEDIHRCVKKFMKSINDYLSVCRLISNISDDQFIDELIHIINKFDTKVTHFFFSTLLTSILTFKYKTNQMKVILWSNDAKKLSFISQLLVVIHQFLKSKTMAKSFLAPQMKSIKFCQNMKATKSVVSERKSRDESLGYESLTESMSATTSTICDYNGFACKTLDASTPLERSLELSAEGLEPALSAVERYEPTDEMQSSSQLNKSRNYIREYRNLRFTANHASDDSTDEDIDSKSLNRWQNNDMNDSYSQNSSNSSRDDDYESDTITDVEVINESYLLSGFGEISMPELTIDSSNHYNEISLSQSPTISDTYLSQILIQGIINSKTITTYEDMISKCLERSSNDLNDNTIIVCDCDLWRINYIESSQCCPAIMSASIGQLCETIVELYSLRLNTHFIRQFIDNRINELIVKSIVLKKVIESNDCVDSQSQCHERRRQCLGLFEKDSNQSLLPLIVDNYINGFSTNDCLSLGFDVSDIPLIIALNRHSLRNNYKNTKHFERNETHFLETKL